MMQKKELFEKLKLYAITDLKSYDSKIIGQVEDICRGGAGTVQLRSKVLRHTQLLTLGKQLREITSSLNVLFIVNDHVDLALELNADGVHLGQDDLPIEQARILIKKAQKNMLIGKSTHSLEQALKAQEEGADYIGVGPVFSTPTKPGRNPVGLNLVKQISREIDIPFVAIGGINLNNSEQVLKAGARCIAVVRALFDTRDCFQAAEKFYAKIRSYEQNVKVA